MSRRRLDAAASTERMNQAASTLRGLADGSSGHVQITTETACGVASLLEYFALYVASGNHIPGMRGLGYEQLMNLSQSLLENQEEDAPSF